MHNRHEAIIHIIYIIRIIHIIRSFKKSPHKQEYGVNWIIRYLMI